MGPLHDPALEPSNRGADFSVNPYSGFTFDDEAAVQIGERSRSEIEPVPGFWREVRIRMDSVTRWWREVR
jgi:hypothetical protein